MSVTDDPQVIDEAFLIEHGDEILAAYGDEPDAVEEMVAEMTAADPTFPEKFARAVEQAKAQRLAWNETPYDRFAGDVVEGLVDQVEEYHDTRPEHGDDPRTLAAIRDAQRRIVAALQDAYAAGREDAQRAVDAVRAG